MLPPDEEDDEENESEDDSGQEPTPEKTELDQGQPRTVHEALKLKQDLLARAIIQVLHERPNHSCIRAKTPDYILKRWEIRTRGRPRRQFAKKVDDLIAKLDRQGYVIVYKSKNVRIRVGPRSLPELAVPTDPGWV